MHDLYVGISLNPGETMLQVRVTKAEGYKVEREWTLSLEALDAVLFELDKATSGNLTGAFITGVAANRARVEERIKTLEAALAAERAKLA